MNCQRHLAVCAVTNTGLMKNYYCIDISQKMTSVDGNCIASNAASLETAITVTCHVLCDTGRRVNLSTTGSLLRDLPMLL